MSQPSIPQDLARIKQRLDALTQFPIEQTILDGLEDLNKSIKRILIKTLENEVKNITEIIKLKMAMQPQPSMSNDTERLKELLTVLIEKLTDLEHS